MTYRVWPNTAAAAPDLAPSIFGKFDQTFKAGSQATTDGAGDGPAITTPLL
jgi:hypothetical protein